MITHILTLESRATFQTDNFLYKIFSTPVSTLVDPSCSSCRAVSQFHLAHLLLRILHLQQIKTSSSVVLLTSLSVLPSGDLNLEMSSSMSSTCRDGRLDKVSSFIIFGSQITCPRCTGCSCCPQTAPPPPHGQTCRSAGCRQRSPRGSRSSR